MTTTLLKTGSRWLTTIGLLSLVALAAPEAQGQFPLGVPSKWSDFLCIGDEVCAVGDFNGDGFDDVIAFVRNSVTGTGEGDAFVGLSTGQSFAPAQKWSDWICIGHEVCSVGDFNGDGRDDVIAFARNNDTGAGQGDAWVALSTGSGFEPAQKWSDWICVVDEVCAVGDFNGDDLDDAIAFVRNTNSDLQGDAYVALSTGGGFAPAQKWSDWICVGYEFCSVGDFNGDQRDDVIAFVRNNDLGPGQGDAWVALSTGTGFALAEKWSDWICVAEEVCAVGDFDRDYIDDVIAFSRNATGAQGDAYVALSLPWFYGGGFRPAQKWSDWICVGYEVCGVGDFNRDDAADVVAFVRNTQVGAGQGDVWVALGPRRTF